MKKVVLFIVLGILTIQYCFSQNKADDIVGYYLSPDIKSDDLSQMEIYRAQDGTYEAKVVWISNKAKSHFLGTVQIWGLIYDADKKEWRNGKVRYDGSDYSITVSICEPGKLKLRGYVGFSLLGKTIYWIKEKELRK